jgi:hypothetical protein
MIRAILSELAAASWRDWLACLAEFAGMAVIVASIALICVGLAPDLNP